MAQTFKNAKAVLDTTATTIYTCPMGTTAVVIGCQVINSDDLGLRDLKMWWTDSSDSNSVGYLAFNVAVPPNAVYEPLGGKLVLEAGDTIVATSSTALDLESSISVLELS